MEGISPLETPVSRIAFGSEEGSVLPNELLIKVFGFLKWSPRVTLVCRLWNRLYEDSFEMSLYCVERVIIENPENLWSCFDCLFRRYKQRRLVFPSLDALRWGLEQTTQVGYIEGLRLLLKDPRTVHIRNDDFQSLLRIAVASRRRQSVKVLLEDPRIDPRARLSKAFRMACCLDCPEIVETLLKDGRSSVNAKDNQGIQLATKKGSLEIVNLLLRYPQVNPSVRGNFCLLWASRLGHTDVVKRLLEDPRVDPAVLESLALRLAAERGHAEVVKLLMKDPRVLPQVQNNAALMEATSGGHVEVVRLLIQDPRVYSTAQMNPVLWSMVCGQLAWRSRPFNVATR